MAIHVAVVDDDQAVHSRISDFLKRYGEEKSQPEKQRQLFDGARLLQ